MRKRNKTERERIADEIEQFKSLPADEKRKDVVFRNDPWDVKRQRTSSTSPYWDYVSGQMVNESGEMPEPKKANPDGLDEEMGKWLPRFTDGQRKKLTAIQDSLHLLSPIEMKIIVLIYTENLTQEDIGNRLKISQQRVSIALGRAREKIQRVYRKEK